jgi:transglycosylase-like protein with SLT domain
MGRLIRLIRPRSAISRSFVLRSAAGCGALLLIAVGGSLKLLEPTPGANGINRPHASASASSSAGAAVAQSRTPGSFRQIILPDLLVVAPKGLTRQELTQLARIPGVRNMISFDGAQITAGSRQVSVIGVNPSSFRPWVPLQTASDQAFWTALAGGQFVASPAARTALQLRPGASYQLTGAASVSLTFGASASLGIGEVDMLVNTRVSRQLGLVHSVAALISAPGLSMSALTAGVGKVLGPSARTASLRQQQIQATSPSVTPAHSGGTSTSGLPTTYLQLFQESAAKYCPGLSWTVLAAIGQIESGDGANEGPSPAGALGPMQFLPSTWAVWGIDGFGQTGPPNIMNPYDAVPSAARLLCANGATGGGNSLARAIFDYNHAVWYVNDVLALAAQYARNY